MRVQIPAYTDKWMQGDRYGEIVKVNLRTVDGYDDLVEVARVKLDISGKLVRVILADCTVVS